MDADQDDDLLYESIEDLEDERQPAISEQTEKEAKKEEERQPIEWNADDDEKEEGERSESDEEPEPPQRSILLARRVAEAPVRRDIPSWSSEVEAKKEEITEDDIQTLYDSMEVDLLDPNVRASALFLHSEKPITVFDAERLFAEYNPLRCALLSANTAVIKFGTAYETAEALIHLTKRLVRVRKETAPEEGEVEEDEEDEDAESDEEGRLKRKDIVIVRSRSRKRPNFADAVDVDVEEVKIPSGKWRVVVQHVPTGRYIFVRLAMGAEIRQSMVAPYKDEVTDRRDNPTEDPEYESAQNFKKQKVRPGLNVFDDKGRELDWDYEHDTRFYDKAEGSQKRSSQTEEEPIHSGKEEIIMAGETKIRSRGRGTKKFIEALLEDSD